MAERIGISATIIAVRLRMCSFKPSRRCALWCGGPANSLRPSREEVPCQNLGSPLPRIKKFPAKILEACWQPAWERWQPAWEFWQPAWEFWQPAWKFWQPAWKFLQPAGTKRSSTELTGTLKTLGFFSSVELLLVPKKFQLVPWNFF